MKYRYIWCYLRNPLFRVDIHDIAEQASLVMPIVPEGFYGPASIRLVDWVSQKATYHT